MGGLWLLKTAYRARSRKTLFRLSTSSKGGFPLLEAFRTLQIIEIKAVDRPDRFLHAQDNVQLA